MNRLDAYCTSAPRRRPNSARLDSVQRNGAIFALRPWNIGRNCHVLAAKLERILNLGEQKHVGVELRLGQVVYDDARVVK